MAKDFLTDAEMNRLTQSGSGKKSAPSFISDKDMEVLSAQKPKEAVETADSPLQTGIQEAGNAASLGYLPHLAAIAQPIQDRLVNPLIAPLVKGYTGQDISQTKSAPWSQMIPGTDAYIQARDENIKRMMKDAAANPKAALTGKVIGTLSGGAALGSALPVAEGVGGVAELSALQSGLMNPGDKEGQVGLQLGDRARNAAYGGATGAILGSVLSPEAGAIATRALTKTGSALTGLSENELANYASRTKEVNDLITNSGGDIHEAANLVRQDLENSLNSKKNLLNAQITKTLKQYPKDENIPVGDITDTLTAAKNKLNPNFKSDEIAEIDGIITKINKQAPNGVTDLSGLNDIKKYLQKAAKPAYKQGGQIFLTSDEAQNAARTGAYLARDNLNKLAPDIAEANNGLSVLHELEDSINSNLITPGKPEAALLAAGSGGNAKSIHDLNRMQEITGYPAMQRAKDLSAAKAFASPSVLPVDTTGKAAVRMGAAAGLGSLAGPAGIIAGGALTSPLSVKALINIGSKSKPLFNALNQVIGTDPVRASYIVNTLSRNSNSLESAPQIDEESTKFFKDNPNLIQDIPDADVRNAIRESVKKNYGAVERRMKR